MRKIALLSLILVATVITVISCQKNKHFNDGTNPAHSPGKYQTKDGEMSIGQLEVLCVSIYDSLYHVSDSINEPTFETIAIRSANILQNVLGLPANTSDDTAVGRIVNTWAYTKGYLDVNNSIKPTSDCVPLMIANETNTDLKYLFTNVHQILSTTGPAQLDLYIASEISNLSLSPDEFTRASAYRSVLTNGAVYYMGKLMPATVAEANAMGAVDGMLWYYETGGHNYYGQNTMLFWSLSFATAYSNAVACSHPNAQ